MLIARLNGRRIFQLVKLGVIRTSSQNFAVQSDHSVGKPSEVLQEAENKSCGAKNKPNKQKRLSVVARQISEKLSEQDLSVLPRKALREQARAPITGYLVDYDVAESIYCCLREENLNVDGTAVEISAGLGLWTKQLLNLGFKALTCFEEDLELALRLQLNFPAVYVIKKRFLRLAELDHIDRRDGENRTGTLLDKIHTSKICNQSYVFGVTPRADVINFTLLTLVTSKVLHDEQLPWKHPTYYLLLSPRTFQVLTATPEAGFYNYRPVSVLFQLLFQWKLVAEFPRKAFIPWETHGLARDKSKRGKKEVLNPETCYLVKFQANTELINSLSKEKLFSLYFFVKQNLHSRKFAVIPQLEKFVPDCGPRLIRRGFTIFTHFGQLTPEEILHLYLDFTAWPEFEFSSFTAAAEKYHSKLEIADEDVMGEDRS